MVDYQINDDKNSNDNVRRLQKVKCILNATVNLKEDYSFTLKILCDKKGKIMAKEFGSKI